MDDNDPFPASLPGGYRKADENAGPNPYLQEALAEKAARDAKEAESEINDRSLGSIATLAGALFIALLAVTFVAFMPAKSSSDLATPAQSEQVDSPHTPPSKAKARLTELLEKAKSRKAKAKPNAEAP